MSLLTSMPPRGAQDHRDADQTSHTGERTPVLGLLGGCSQLESHHSQKWGRG